MKAAFVILLISMAAALSATAESDLRLKGLSELRRMVQELSLVNESTEQKLQITENQLMVARSENTKLVTDIANLRQWGINQYNRAEQAEQKYWKEAKAHNVTKAKLRFWHAAGSALVFVVVFLLLIQLTQYLTPPWSFAIPLGAAGTAAAAVWIFL